MLIRIHRQSLRLLRYSFTNEQEKQERQQRIENIKRIREQQSVKRMLDQVETTTGYNSLWETVKIHRNMVMLLAVTMGLTGFTIYMCKNCQIYQNPITMKKTLLVVNTRKEEEITDQFYENVKMEFPAQNLTPQMKQKCQKLKNTLGGVISRVKWGKNGLRHYSIHIVSSKNHIVYLLPTAKVIISSTALHNFPDQTLIFLIRLQQSYYNQHLHVRSAPYLQLLSLTLHNTKRPLSLANHNKLTKLFFPSFQHSNLQQCYDYAEADGQPLAISIEKCKEMIESVLKQSVHDSSSMAIRNMFMKFQK